LPGSCFHEWPFPVAAVDYRVIALEAAITTFIERHNANPKPFRWMKSADEILASIERFCAYNAPARA